MKLGGDSKIHFHHPLTNIAVTGAVGESSTSVSARAAVGTARSATICSRRTIGCWTRGKKKKDENTVKIQ